MTINPSIHSFQDFREIGSYVCLTSCFSFSRPSHRRAALSSMDHLVTALLVLPLTISTIYGEALTKEPEPWNSSTSKEPSNPWAMVSSEYEFPEDSVYLQLPQGSDFCLCLQRCAVDPRCLSVSMEYLPRGMRCRLAKRRGSRPRLSGVLGSDGAGRRGIWHLRNPLRLITPKQGEKSSAQWSGVYMRAGVAQVTDGCKQDLECQRSDLGTKCETKMSASMAKQCSRGSDQNQKE